MFMMILLRFLFSILATLLFLPPIILPTPIPPFFSYCFVCFSNTYSSECDSLILAILTISSCVYWLSRVEILT